VDGEYFLERKKVVKVPYPANRYFLAIEPLEFADNVPYDLNILPEPVFVIGVAAKGVV
jgi:hypothetical protein